MTKNIKSIKAYLNWFLYSKLDIFATWVPKKRTPWYDVLWILNLIIIGIPVVVPVKFTRTLWAHWFQPTCFCFFFFLKYFQTHKTNLIFSLWCFKGFVTKITKKTPWYQLSSIWLHNKNYSSAMNQQFFQIYLGGFEV